MGKHARITPVETPDDQMTDESPAEVLPTPPTVNPVSPTKAEELRLIVLTGAGSFTCGGHCFRKGVPQWIDAGTATKLLCTGKFEELKSAGSEA
jgi:hypothetical protein